MQLLSAVEVHWRERPLCIGMTEESLSEEVRFKHSFNTAYSLVRRRKGISFAGDGMGTPACLGPL